MSFRNINNSAVFVMVALPSVVNAADLQEKHNGWMGNVELGVVNTIGNTKTQIVNAKAKAQLDREN